MPHYALFYKQTNTLPLGIWMCNQPGGPRSENQNLPIDFKHLLEYTETNRNVVITMLYFDHFVPHAVRGLWNNICCEFSNPMDVDNIFFSVCSGLYCSHCGLHVAWFGNVLGADQMIQLFHFKVSNQVILMYSMTSIQFFHDVLTYCKLWLTIGIV